MSAVETGMSAAELRALPVTVDLVTAGRALGIGRTTSYRLQRRGEFPVPVIRAGTKLRVARAALLAALDFGSRAA